MRCIDNQSCKIHITDESTQIMIQTDTSNYLDNLRISLVIFLCGILIFATIVIILKYLK